MNYQQRNALASSTKGLPPTVPPLYTADYTPTFGPLEAQTMGNLGLPTDGWDALLAPLIAAVPGLGAVLAGIDVDLIAMGFTPGQIDSTVLAPIAVQFADVARVGDAQLAAYYKWVGLPPDPGGGGGGGGTPPPTHIKPIPPPPTSRLPLGCYWKWSGTGWVGLCSGHGGIPVPYPELG